MQRADCFKPQPGLLETIGGPTPHVAAERCALRRAVSCCSCPSVGCPPTTPRIDTLRSRVWPATGSQFPLLSPKNAKQTEDDFFNNSEQNMTEPSEHVAAAQRLKRNHPVQCRFRGNWSGGGGGVPKVPPPRIENTCACVSSIFRRAPAVQLVYITQ